MTVEDTRGQAAQIVAPYLPSLTAAQASDLNLSIAAALLRVYDLGVDTLTLGGKHITAERKVC